MEWPSGGGVCVVEVGVESGGMSSELAWKPRTDL